MSGFSPLNYRAWELFNRLRKHRPQGFGVGGIPGIEVTNILEMEGIPKSFRTYRKCLIKRIELLDGIELKLIADKEAGKKPGDITQLPANPPQ